MNKEQIKILLEQIEQVEKDYDFNDYIQNYTNQKDLEELDFDDLEDFLTDLNDDYSITETEVIYYSNAIEYLKKNDPSLRESLEIAEEYGMTLNNISSETLASLLKSRNNLDDYADFISRIIALMGVEK